MRKFIGGLVNDSIEQAVLRSIVTMREGLGEALTVQDLARSAMFSKFHFTRIFRRTTGVTPGRFLSAMRLQCAKGLLLTTDLTIAHISARVGYHSVGTFSSRFSRSVGMSPTGYRRLAGRAALIATEPDRPAYPVRARVHGHARTPGDRQVSVVVGLFPDRIPEGRPASRTVLEGLGRYELDTVPSGTWHLFAQALPSRPDRRGEAYVCAKGPITVRQDSELIIDLDLHPARALDPPALSALLDAGVLPPGARLLPSARCA